MLLTTAAAALHQAGGATAFVVPTACIVPTAVVARSPHLSMRNDLPRSTQLNRQAFNRRNMSIDERRAFDALMEERKKNRQLQLIGAAIVLAGLWGTALFGPR